MEFHLFKGRNVSLHPCSARLPNCLLVLLSFVLHSLSRVYYSVETVAFLSLSLSTFLFQQAAIKTPPRNSLFKTVTRRATFVPFLSMYTRIYLSSIFFLSFFLPWNVNLYYALVIAINEIFPFSPFFSIHFSKIYAAILLKIRFNVVNSWQSLLGIISSRSWKRRGSVDYERGKSRTLVTKWLIGGKKKKKKKDIRRTKKKTWEHSFKFMAGKISFVESNWTSVHRVAGCKSYVYLL